VKFEPDVTPASRLDLSWAYTIDLARSLGRLAFKERMEFAPTLHNDGLLYAWEPC
jgi:hypothetical protein